MSKKEYLAFTDLTITEIISQKNQMKLMKNYLKEHNADIVFYSTEGHRTIETMRILENKISENPHVDGIVFYSILQFSYSGKFLSKITKKILKKGYELFFIREDIKITDLKSFEKIKISLKIFPYTHSDLIKNLKANFYNVIKIK